MSTRSSAPSGAGRGSPTRPFGVLFVCTHNSARSQIAEAILRVRGGERFDVASAGSHPSGTVHALAIAVIREIGGDPKLHWSKGFEAVLAREWDLVVTVCDQARESCPLFLGPSLRAHWGVPDPSLVRGTEEQRLAAFRATHRLLDARIAQLIEVAGASERSRMKEAIAALLRSEHPSQD